MRDVIQRLENQERDTSLRIQKTLKFINENLEFLKNFFTYVGDARFVIYAESPKGLHKLRKQLKKYFHKWNDKLGTVWYSGVALAAYSSEDNPGIEIWLRLKTKEMEEYLNKGKKNKCKFIETPNSPSMTYVCNMS